MHCFFAPGVDWPPVPIRACTVSFVGASGVRHVVEVMAESLYETAARAAREASKRMGGQGCAGRGNQR
jgi:hypothetical protein